MKTFLTSILIGSFFLVGSLTAQDSGPRATLVPMGYMTESYNLTVFRAFNLAANATAGYQIQAPVSRFSFYMEGGNASFTFNTATATAYIASQTDSWESYNASDPVHLEPIELASGSFIWIQNGGTAQTVRIKTYGRQNY